MNNQASYSRTNIEQSIKPEQLTQIVAAILDGKYSWACFLLLRCAGYNPCDYFPYRTYHRLVKENGGIEDSSKQGKPDCTASVKKTNCQDSVKQVSNIKDLPHLEKVAAESQQVRGGYSQLAVFSKVQSFFGWKS
jgi:hypothetical protein